MATLNYNHLRYFRAVARTGHLGRTAQALNVSQSALSTQIKTLEDRIGQALFDRTGRTLTLTEAGRIALDYADRIFSAGDELVATLERRRNMAQPLKVGALSTLSRNFQLQFLRPLFASQSARIDLRSGSMAALMADLEIQALDVVLTTEVPPGGAAGRFAARKIAEQSVGLHGRPDFLTGDTLADLLRTAPLILPTDAVIRTQVEDLLHRLGVTATIAASVDDMAMVRLLAREGLGLAVTPAVVLADEIAYGLVATAPFDLGVVEPFFAVTLPRTYPHPALQGLLADIEEA
ncbi:MAG: LysR family transcriptional regulator [Pseudomonadota bacterium]